MIKIWQKPKLIILSRGRPEELVLVGCKMAGTTVLPKNKNQGCYSDNKCKVICSTVSAS
jgi:hypothetical protein